MINRNDGTAHAIHNFGASPLISHVTAIARGGGGSGAFKAGVWDDSESRSRLDHVTARALGVGGASPCIGLYSRDSVTRAQGSRFVANGCTINNSVSVADGGRVLLSDTHIIARNSPSGNDNGLAVTSFSGSAASAVIRNSQIRGSILADGSGAPATVRVGVSLVNGTVTSGASGDIKCVGDFDADCTIVP